MAFGHVPYRRDCPVCLQSSQQIVPHRRNKRPQTGVLALDTCGPLLPASDVGSWNCRYFLAGAYTYMVPKGTKKMTDPPEEEGGLEGAPVLDQGAEESGGEGQGHVEEQVAQFNTAVIESLATACLARKGRPKKSFITQDIWTLRRCKLACR